MPTSQDQHANRTFNTPPQRTQAGTTKSLRLAPGEISASPSARSRVSPARKPPLPECLASTLATSIPGQRISSTQANKDEAYRRVQEQRMSPGVGRAFIADCRGKKILSKILSCEQRKYIFGVNFSQRERRSHGDQRV